MVTTAAATGIIVFPRTNATGSMPTNLLNLPNYQITSVQDTEHDYHVYAETKHPPTSCPYCQSSELVGFGRREQLIRDLPAQGRRVGVHVSTRRMQCRSCSKTFSEALPDVDERRAMMKRLLEWIGRQSVSRTFASISEDVGVVEGTVRAIFRDYINELEAKVRFETPKWMGIDEIHIIKPRCVITNIQNNTVVNMLANRNKDTVARYLFELEKRDRIQYVAMDMWTPYRDAVRTVLPDAAVIVDKFHVVRMANVAMESVRKSIRAELSPKARRGLMHDRFVLLKRQRDLTDKEAFNLDGWTKNYPCWERHTGSRRLSTRFMMQKARNRRYAPTRAGISPSRLSLWSTSSRSSRHGATGCRRSSTTSSIR